MKTARQPDPKKIELLRSALAEVEDGKVNGGLFDVQAEKVKLEVRRRALLLLDSRARSVAELERRLVDLEFDVRVIKEVLNDLLRVGLLDDAAFANEWVRQRHQLRGKSASVLDRELREKGVGQSERQNALAQVSQESEEQIAWELAQKKARQIKAVPDNFKERDKHMRRILGVLARRGFGSGLSITLARQALDERIAELEQSL